MSKRPTQYTIRNVPPRVDAELRRKAKQSGRSLNELALEALIYASGQAETSPVFHDLDRCAGTWIDDPTVDDALMAQRTIDQTAWS